MLTKKVAGRVYNYDYCIGTSAPAGKGFERPVDFTLGSGGSVYVLSRSGMNGPGWGITKCTLDHDFIWEDRGPNFCGRQSRWPRCVALDSDENVYISDDIANVIFLYDVQGNFQGKWGTGASGDGQLNSPYGLAFDKEDNLFVADSLNNRIQKFTREGKFLAKWGSLGSGEGEFNMPWGIAFDKLGDVYVADWKNDRVQKFSPEGEYLATFGGPGAGKGELRLSLRRGHRRRRGCIRHRLGQRALEYLCARWQLPRGLYRGCGKAIGLGPGRDRCQPGLPESPTTGRPDRREMVQEADGGERG